MIALINKYYDPGSLAFRRLIGHSSQVVGLADQVAAQLEGGCNLDRTFVREAAWLHDIGIFLTDAPDIGCHGEAPYLMHGILGARLLEKEGLPRHALVCERHIGVGLSVEDIRKQGLPLPLRTMSPQTVEEEIVAYADLFFSKHRKGIRPIEDVRKSLGRFGNAKVAIFDAWHARFRVPE